MKKMILLGLVVASGLGCHATTSIGSTDAGCNVSIPQAGFYGLNILYPGNDQFVAASEAGPPFPEYELMVEHDATATVRVTMTLLSGTGGWGLIGLAGDWEEMQLEVDGGFQSQAFGAPNVTGEFEEAIAFYQSGQARVDLFECDASTPLSRTISWAPGDAGGG